MNKKIIFSTGGTGGHIFPAIHLMRYFSEKKYKVLLITDIRGKIFLKNYPELESYVLKADTLTNKNFFKKIFSFFIIIYSIIKSVFILKKEKPDLIFGLGGYASFPICVASRFFNLPLVIYESNTILGRANKYLTIFSKKIFLAKKIQSSFPLKYQNKTYQVGPILDKNIINYTNIIKNKDRQNFSILVLGGSQGAEIFGKVIPMSIKKLKEKGYSVKINQQCIKTQKDSIVDFYKKNNIQNYIFEFENDVIKLILSADLVITRCGASTTDELVYTRTPFIAVPLPNSIDNHQFFNAKYYENKGCCWLLEQSNFNSENLFNLVFEIMKDKKKIEIIKANMKKNYNNNVYNDIEKEIKEFV